MEIENYLTPPKLSNPSFESYSYGKSIEYFSSSGFPDLDNVKVVILGVMEDRKSCGNAGTADAPDRIREYFYSLSSIPNLKVADIGNIIPGDTLDDSLSGIEYVCSFLMEKNILPIILGGSQYITLANYLAYRKKNQTVNIVCVDRKFDFGDTSSEVNSESYLTHIIQHPCSLLFNYCHLGHQIHFVNPSEIDLLRKMYFDVYRLGQLQASIEEAEPMIRNADILSFDISSIRFSDAPGTFSSTPNGLYGEEACQLMRFAGMSDKLSSMGIYEVNPAYDHRSQTSALAAQMVWYFLEGVANRKNDYPVDTDDDYLKYRITMKTPGQEMVFFKSKKTDRWWMEVPYGIDTKSKYERHHIVPCSYEDYKVACKEEMPDRWWQAYQKLN